MTNRDPDEEFDTFRERLQRAADTANAPMRIRSGVRFPWKLIWRDLRAALKRSRDAAE